ELRRDDDLAAVVAVAEPAEPYAQHQKWCPVTDDGEASERGGVERLEDHPVRDHVLDVVAHHRQEARREVRAERAMSQRREGRAGRCGRRREGYVFRLPECDTAAPLGRRVRARCAKTTKLRQRDLPETASVR